MRKELLLLLLMFVLAAVVVMTPFESQAVPSFARQVQKPCTACHTVWGNLNQYGRQFKVKAYTDVSQDWQMIDKDNLSLPTIFPFSARVTLEPMVHESGATPPGSTDVNQVSIFMASRIFNYAGIFTSAEADGFSETSGGGTFTIPTVKAAFQYPLGDGNTIGLVVFSGLASAADPFNSLGGRDRDLSFDDEASPFILNTGWTFNFSAGTNLGEVVHGYFLGNRLYAAVGLMRGGAADDGTLAGVFNTDNADPYDVYSRVAWDQKLPNGAVTIGLVNYNGTQRLNTSGPGNPGATPLYDSKVSRTYADLSLEQNYGEDHLVEVQALAGGGKDNNVLGGGETGKFNGSYVQADYYYDRTYGVIGSINNIKYTQTAEASDPSKKNSWLVGFNYLPWLNTKVALQYSSTKTTNLDGSASTDKISRVVLDLLF